MARRFVVLLASVALVAASCGSGEEAASGSITVYSGRAEELVAPLIQQFEADTGVSVEVRYAGSAELAATILEEGENSPADVFFAQDPASLGAVALGGYFRELDDSVLDSVDSAFSDDAGRWVGVSGRARVVVYDTGKIDPASLPATENGFTDPAWAGRLAVAPTNGSFLAFVAAKILLDGDAATLAWLEAIRTNNSPTYPKNSVIVTAVDDGEVDAGLVNHYYLFRRQDEVGATAAANHFMTGGGAGSLVMPAGAGILASTDNADGAEAFIEYLLDDSAQRYFADETFEYPLTGAVPPNDALPPLRDLNPPALRLSELAGVLDRATDLVAEAGLL